MGDWELTEESFNLFLSWLDPDRNSAGKKYEALRARLVVVLEGRGCPHADEIAAESLRRFIRRLPAMIDTFDTRDPVPYLLVTARHLHLEHAGKQFLPLPANLPEVLAADEENTAAELLDECLEECLGKLEPADRELALDYYREERQAKIDFRKELAGRRGLTPNALRIKVHHLRGRLHACIDECVARK